MNKICKNCGHREDKHYTGRDCMYEYDHGAGISCDCEKFVKLQEGGSSTTES